METNEKISADINIKIAIWLKHEHIHEEIWMNPITHANYWIDYLHDRNQQKWIEQKLIGSEYRISYNLCETRVWLVNIYKDWQMPWNEIYKSNWSKDLAFLQAVEQIIDKTKL